MQGFHPWSQEAYNLSYGDKQILLITSFVRLSRILRPEDALVRYKREMTFATLLSPNLTRS